MILSIILSSREEALGGLVISIIVTLFIFLICRELVCWYFKINQQIKQNDKIIHNLERLRVIMGDTEIEQGLIKDEHIKK